MICIERTNITKVLAATIDGEVVHEVSVRGRAKQLWKKGEPDAEGFFTLENSEMPKFITAISESGLEIQGNITLRWITSQSIVNYSLLFTLFLNRS